MKFSFSKTLVSVFASGIVIGVAATSVAGAAFKGSTIFRDVPYGHYADDAIGEMYQLGIIKGMDSAHFAPDEPVTRGQVAVLLQRLRNEIKGISSSVASSSSRSSSSSSSSSVSSSSSSSSSSSTSSSSSSSSYNPGGSVHFDVGTYNVDKNISTGQVTILVVRTGGNAGAGTVDYSFSGGTAVSGKNYQPISGTLTFANKQTSAKLTMVIMNDTSTTGTKTVNLVLKKPTGALTLATPYNIMLNINDPNNPNTSSSASSTSSTASSAGTTVTLSAMAYGVAENGGSVTVTVNRTGITTTSVGVNYVTTAGTAASGVDYTNTSGTFTFASGETTKTFSVPIANNGNVDGNRSFNVNLNTPTGGAAIGVASAPVTINDDESLVLGSGSLKFSASSYQASITSGIATITVNHVGGLGAVNVNYATTGGSGMAGTDYTSTSGTLSFAAGETSKTFTIPLLNHTGYTGGKTVNLQLSSPTGNVPLADPASASLLINE